MPWKDLVFIVLAFIAMAEVVLLLLLDRWKEKRTHRQIAREADSLLQTMEQERPIRASAQRRIPQIRRGLRQDGRAIDRVLVRRIARAGADGYIQGARWREPIDRATVYRVFEEVYREALLNEE